VLLRWDEPTELQALWRPADTDERQPATERVTPDEVVRPSLSFKPRLLSVNAQVMSQGAPPLQSGWNRDAFGAVFGVRRGVAKRSRAEQEQADARDGVANDVDAFLSAHADHGRAIQFRHHVDLPGQPARWSAVAATRASTPR
jgi:hypothetical protein